ncbi:hypothetical protein, partial [Streptomyces longwoodensis]|uniref:hypothetical protein n=1 Tax=Streptomyces longwoodensis TaxID=68231 RepID=UPI0033EB6AAE
MVLRPRRGSLRQAAGEQPLVPVTDPHPGRQHGVADASEAGGGRVARSSARRHPVALALEGVGGQFDALGAGAVV